MKVLLRKIKNKAKKAVNEFKAFKPANYSRARYFWYREHCRIDEKLILLEAAVGKRPAENMAAMLREFAENPIYKEYKLVLAVSKKYRADREDYLTLTGIKDRVTCVEINSLQYYKVLATAKYLLCEDSFIYIFTKRPEQVYLNTWHGTPLMNMGKNKKTDFAMIGNEQKNFFDADYLLCQGEYAMNCMIEDYMLENFAKTKIWLGGYPRNDIFKTEGVRERVRRECCFEDKTVIAYMPTWRKNTKEQSLVKRTKQMAAYLKQWDEELAGDQIVYVKQHPANAVKIDFSTFLHIHPFPESFGTYEFLTAADMLVTDYSSVMFDYALTGRKTVLFAYDEEQYEEIRGLHVPLEQLPFPKAATVEELMEAINGPKNYDEAAFLATYVSHEKGKITEELCRKFIFGDATAAIEEREIPYNGKKNVVLYIGSFEKNGLTTAGANLLHNLDRTKNNYAVFYCMTSVQLRQESIRVIPEDISLMTFYYFRSLTFSELLPYIIWRGFRNTPYKFVAKIMKRLSQRGAQRMLMNCRIDTVVQFTGYNDEMIGAMEQMPCNRVIYVHSDMEKEINLRENANKGLLSHAYKSYDAVAAVTDGMIPPARRIAESDKEKGAKEANFVLCRNVIDYKRIERLGEELLEFDSDTAFNVDRANLLEALESDKKKFVSVGRFSVEKGHERLIQAFEKLHAKHPDTCLIIIGGHGDLWASTVRQVKESSCPDSIFLVRYMSNPFPLVKQCDFFALSSLYEGFGLVLAEADVLGLPCFTVDIMGPRGFMQKYNGLLVENSADGLLAGMLSCMDGTIAPRLSIDYAQYNRDAVEQFESVI